MSAHTPGWRRPPIFTTTRLTIALIIAVPLALVLLTLAGSGAGWSMLAYLAFAVATAWMLRSVRHEAVALLGRRVVRRGVVAALAATCVALVAIAALASAQAAGSLPFLVALLVLLNVAVGWATLRMATAPDGMVDERQESLRNRAHRIAYWTFVAVVGLPILVAQLASPATRSWLAGAVTNGGAGLTFLELLLALPAMVVAWLEPDHLAPEVARRLDGRARLALGMLVVAIAWPALLSVGLVVLPVRTTSSIEPLASSVAPNHCVELTATSQVGLGVDARIPIHAVACGDGRTASQGWGLNPSDCQIASSVMATVATSRCAHTVDAEGTLSFTYGATVRPSLLPFLSREVTMRVVVDRDGRVVRFP